MGQLTQVVPRIGLRWLTIAAAVSVGLWLAVEASGVGLTHPLHAQMLRAAQAASAAARIVHGEKQKRGLLQPADVDPNETGLIGPEFTEITTSQGFLEAKRTATNPDLAALLVRLIGGLPHRPGDAVGVVLSGSFVGGNIAALTATEALGLHAMAVSSLSASMFGATDLDLVWLDMEAAIRARGVVTSRSLLAVLGGYGAIARSMDPVGAAALQTAARRNAVQLVDGPLDTLIATIEARLLAEAGGRARIAALINVGGAVLALGTCQDADRLPVGLSRTPLSCIDGVPGLVVRLSQQGVPVIHLLNLKRFALDHGLPYDPLPLPAIGNNARIYGN